MGDEEAHEDVEDESEDSLSFTVDFRPGELLMMYQILSSAEMYLEKEEMDLYSSIAGGLSRKVLFAMLDEEFKDAVNDEVQNVSEILDTGSNNPLSFQ